MQYQYPGQVSPMMNNVAASNIIFVNSPAEAANYPCAFGISLLFLDRNQDRFYIKSVDQSGVASPLRVFDYSEIIEQPPTGDFVPKSEFEKLQAELNELKQQISKQNNYHHSNNYNKNRGYNNNGQQSV